MRRIWIVVIAALVGLSVACATAAILVGLVLPANLFLRANKSIQTEDIVTTSQSTEGRLEGSLSREDEPRVSTFRIQPSSSATSVHVGIFLDNGTVALSLTDPEGNVVWEEDVDSLKGLSASMRFDPIPGLWTMRLDPDQATGEYDVTWRAELDR